jgi:hypothetical protein
VKGVRSKKQAHFGEERLDCGVKNGLWRIEGRVRSTHGPAGVDPLTNTSTPLLSRVDRPREPRHPHKYDMPRYVSGEDPGSQKEQQKRLREQKEQMKEAIAPGKKRNQKQMEKERVKSTSGKE